MTTTERAEWTWSETQWTTILEIAKIERAFRKSIHRNWADRAAKQLRTAAGKATFCKQRPQTVLS